MSIRECAARIYEYTGLAFAREHYRSSRRSSGVFIWIPKTAGSSLFSIMDVPLLESVRRVRYRFPNRGLVSFGHMRYASLVASGLVSTSFDRSSFKFCFVRNPYDRAVSLFFYLKKIGRLSDDTTFLGFCRRLKSDGVPDIGLYHSIGLSQCNPQARWVEGVTMDYVGRMEALEEDFEKIRSSIGLADIQIPHVNRTRHRHYSQYYCDESEAIVRELYDEDFDRFQYDRALVCCDH